MASGHPERSSQGWPVCVGQPIELGLLNVELRRDCVTERQASATEAVCVAIDAASARHYCSCNCRDQVLLSLDPSVASLKFIRDAVRYMSMSA